MNCARFRSPDILERYLLDRLPERERTAFEMHAFECGECFEELQSLEAVRLALVSEPRKKALPRSRWLWLGLAAAAAIILLWVPTHNRQSPAVSAVRHAAVPAESERLRQLAWLQPPLYRAPVLRGAEDRAAGEFAAAMERYSRGDSQGAAEGLRKAMRSAPGAPGPAFYLGICRLLLGEPERAIEPLQKVVSLGDEAFTESAQFYLGKAYLALGKVPEARRALAGAAACRGALEPEARRLLGALDELSTAR